MITRIGGRRPEFFSQDFLSVGDVWERKTTLNQSFKGVFCPFSLLNPPSSSHSLLPATMIFGWAPPSPKKEAVLTFLVWQDTFSREKFPGPESREKRRKENPGWWIIDGLSILYTSTRFLSELWAVKKNVLLSKAHRNSEHRTRPSFLVRKANSSPTEAEILFL